MTMPPPDEMGRGATLELLRRMEARAKIAPILAEAYEYVDDRRFCLAAKSVGLHVSTELQVVLNPAIYRTIAAVIRDMGGETYENGNRMLYVKVRRCGISDARALKDSRAARQDKRSWWDRWAEWRAKRGKHLTRDELRRIQRVYAQRMSGRGFSDIETPEGQLQRETHLQWVREGNPARLQEQEAYISACRNFLADKWWEDDQERTIWSLHCQGMSIREAAKELGLYKDLVHKVTMRLKQEMLAERLDAQPDAGT